MQHKECNVQNSQEQQTKAQQTKAVHSTANQNAEKRAQCNTKKANQITVKNIQQTKA